MFDVEDYNWGGANVIKQCFIDTQKYKQKYNKSIVLTQIGSFFENYAIKSINNDDEYLGGEILEFGMICDLNIVEKNVKITHIKTGEIFQVFIAGFKDIQEEKYVRKLQSAGFTVIVIVQDSIGISNPTRSVKNIVSPGTHFTDNNVQDTNNLDNNTVCIWIESNTSKIVIGVSSIDIYTGMSSVYEYTVENLKSPTTYDQLEKYISIKNPSECIIISDFDDNYINTIVTYINLKSRAIHKIDIKSKKCKNCEKQNYQKEILSKFYIFENFSIFIKNFYENLIATQSYCYLLDFLSEHNTNIVRKILEPVFENISSRVLLANYSLKQLNILNTNNKQGKFSSVCSMLNECITAMGKRNFNNILLNPSTDEIMLNREYNIIEYIITLPISDKNKICFLLKTIYDIDKIMRFIIMKRITPKEIYMLYKMLKNIILIYEQTSQYLPLIKYLNEIGSYLDINIISELVHYLENTFNIDECKDIKSYSNFTNTKIIKPEVNEELFGILKTQIESENKLEKCCEYFNKLIGNDFVKIHTTEKFSIALQCTIIRCKNLEKKINELDEKSVKLSYISSFDNKKYKFIFNFEDLSFNKYTKSNNFIVCDSIVELCNNMSNLKIDLNNIINKVYNEIVINLENYQNTLMKISNFIIAIDLVLTKASISIKYNYCKPQIEKSENSFISAKSLRHPIIECINTNELYVPNDVDLNDTSILLYGCNAVGKSSIIKAVGIATILAQAGMYVPASSFKYYPYKKIFTRIVNSDNIFEGLSSFVVELLELRTILKLSDNNSLVLGDELVASTENCSGTSIFVAGLEHLSNVKSSYIFATHYHEIVNYEEILHMINNNKLTVKHMNVFYNQSLNKLIYTRKLLDGPGSHIYGLEVSKSLDLPQNFLDRANIIRIKYHSTSGSILEQETSKYNKDKLKGGLCEKCGKTKSEDMHHLYHQKNADANGFITSEDGKIFHKNHPCNLINVCSDCHNDFHKNIPSEIKVEKVEPKRKSRLKL